MPGVRRKTAPLRAALAQLSQPRLLLSDENILGETRPPSLAHGTQLYPGAEARLAKLLAALELQGVTVALALRDPLALLVSGWGHQHMAGHEIAFHSYIEGVVPQDLRWQELVMRLLGCEGVHHVLLWRYEDYPALAGMIARRLTGVAAAARLTGQVAPLLTGPSARALASVARIRAENPKLDYKHALRRAMQQYPRAAGYPPAQPVAPEACADSQTRYQADWQNLRAMAGVTCLTAPGRSSATSCPDQT